MSEADAEQQQADRALEIPAMPSPPPPRDNLVRAQAHGFEVLDGAAEGDGRLATMTGHFAVFDEWTEIDSVFEGKFLERIAPGAFARTIANNRSRMRVTLNHGQDPTFGDKPLGPIERLEEDEIGPVYDVPLIDTSYNRDLLPGLQAGLYGSSFRFRVLKEDFDTKPKRGSHNPEGLPERTINEAQVFEFGPVTFPAYQGASAGLRSMTDQFFTDALVSDPERLRALLAAVPPALPVMDPAPATPPDGTRTYPPISREAFMEKFGNGHR